MKPASRVSVVIEEARWRKMGAGFPAKLRRAARLALVAAKRRAPNEITILLAGDAKLKALNAQFRGRNKPTNVLSFPASSGNYLGDVAIGYQIAAREARESAKSIHDHTLHLAVHGVLHLLGYDHETPREARLMEPLETAILADLGIADPYAPRPRAAN